MFSRRKKIVFMEANKYIFKNIFKSLKIDKNKSQNLAKQKICKITLLFKFEVHI